MHDIKAQMRRIAEHQHWRLAQLQPHHGLLDRQHLDVIGKFGNNRQFGIADFSASTELGFQGRASWVEIQTAGGHTGVFKGFAKV